MLPALLDELEIEAGARRPQRRRLDRLDPRRSAASAGSRCWPRTSSSRSDGGGDPRNPHQLRRGDLRDRMSRHHRDPDAAFWGWCDLWLDPAFASWTLDPEIGHVTAPVLLIQGADDPYGSLEQLDRIEAGACGPVERLLVPGGHSPHLEAEAEVLQAVAAFTRRLPDQPLTPCPRTWTARAA